MDTGRMRRDIYPMSDEIRSALEARGVMAASRSRPASQRNDYVGWISRSKLPETRAKRLAQMVDELERGGVYMHMKWRS